MLSLESANQRVLDIENPEDIADAWEYVTSCIKKAKAIKAMLDEYIIDNAEDTGVREIMLDDARKIIVSKRKVTKFDTEMVYDLFGFEQQQRDVLPKNPAFRKTVIATLIGEHDPETYNEAVRETYQDRVEVKELNTKFLK